MADTARLMRRPLHDLRKAGNIVVCRV